LEVEDFRFFRAIYIYFFSLNTVSVFFVSKEKFSKSISKVKVKFLEEVVMSKIFSEFGVGKPHPFLLQKGNETLTIIVFFAYFPLQKTPRGHLKNT